jgi:hypothetical protein
MSALFNRHDPYSNPYQHPLLPLSHWQEDQAGNKRAITPLQDGTAGQSCQAHSDDLMMMAEPSLAPLQEPTLDSPLPRVELKRLPSFTLPNFDLPPFSRLPPFLHQAVESQSLAMSASAAAAFSGAQAEPSFASLLHSPLPPNPPTRASSFTLPSDLLSSSQQSLLADKIQMTPPQALSAASSAAASAPLAAAASAAKTLSASIVQSKEGEKKTTKRLKTPTLPAAAGELGAAASFDEQQSRSSKRRRLAVDKKNLLENSVEDSDEESSEDISRSSSASPSERPTKTRKERNLIAAQRSRDKKKQMTNFHLEELQLFGNLHKDIKNIYALCLSGQLAHIDKEKEVKLLPHLSKLSQAQERNNIREVVSRFAQHIFLDQQKISALEAQIAQLKGQPSNP